MSTASLVPETWDLHGDDAWRTLRSTGLGRLLVDSFLRLRRADGFSHARALAFAISLVTVQATIAIVGFASAVGEGSVRRGIIDTIHAIAPGSAGRVLTEAVDQARHAGVSEQYWGLAVGLIGAVVTGSTLMGQMERGLNRIYGTEQDRPSVQKYALASLLAVTAGLLAVLAFAALAFGPTIAGTQSESAQELVEAARWPLGFLLFTVSTAVIFRVSPRRHQPSLSWLMVGALVTVVLLVPITVLLGVVFDVNTTFGDTYGPLAGLVALQIWTLLSSIAVLFGGAVDAQLEAVRAGVQEPQDAHKVAESEPDSANVFAPVVAG